MESSSCEVVPETGFTKCHYSYKSLRFTRWVLPKQDNGKPRPPPFVSIDALEEGPLSVQISGGRCFMIGVGADEPEDVASVNFNIREGKFYLPLHAGRCI
jgi:hypothetical protein